MLVLETELAPTNNEMDGLLFVVCWYQEWAAKVGGFVNLVNNAINVYFKQIRIHFHQLAYPKALVETSRSNSSHYFPCSR